MPVVSWLSMTCIFRSQSRQTHTHFSIWGQPLQDEISVMMRASVVSWVPWSDREASSSPSLSLERWFDGNTNTELNHSNIILTKSTDVINSRYSPSNGYDDRPRKLLSIIQLFIHQWTFQVVLMTLTVCFMVSEPWIQVLKINSHDIHTWNYNLWWQAETRSSSYQLDLSHMCSFLMDNDLIQHWIKCYAP